MILDSKCKKCKLYGEKLFLKGERCYSPKCPLLKQRRLRKRTAVSEYGRQLLEKQKVKLLYRLSERQLKRYFKEALKAKGSTPEVLAQMLEMRFDSVIFNAGFAPSRSVARQLVSHGHFLLNGRRHDIPSAILKVGDEISLREQSKDKAPFVNLKEALKKANVPDWLSVDSEQLKIKVLKQPDYQSLNLPFNLSLIVEFYSR
jgi:small subunit ribosomal protein S4